MALLIKWMNKIAMDTYINQKLVNQKVDLKKLHNNTLRQIENVKDRLKDIEDKMSRFFIIEEKREKREKKM